MRKDFQNGEARNKETAAAIGLPGVCREGDPLWAVFKEFLKDFIFNDGVCVRAHMRAHLTAISCQDRILKG